MAIGITYDIATSLGMKNSNDIFEVVSQFCKWIIDCGKPIAEKGREGTIHPSGG